VITLVLLRKEWGFSWGYIGEIWKNWEIDEFGLLKTGRLFGTFGLCFFIVPYIGYHDPN
jgi:hypothetical protein